MDPKLQKAMIRATTPRLTDFIPHEPYVQQAAFLLLDQREALYGGAGGGGKSDALLMSALQYVDIPGYHALLLRRLTTQLTKAGGLIFRAHEWLDGTDARWQQRNNTWTFPSGATLELGHMQYEADKRNYQGPEYQYIGFDELTQFSLTQYTYMMSRLRRLAGISIPMRMRAASNPGGVGHEWVRRRFILPTRADPPDKRRPFIPALLTDNPFLDQDDYRIGLQELDPVERARLLQGDWDMQPEGNTFFPAWFRIVPRFRIPPQARSVRAWDLAGTIPDPKHPDPDYTVSFLLKEHDGFFWYADRTKMRGQPYEVKEHMKATAKLDGIDVPIVMFQDPAQAGISQLDDYSRNVVPGYQLHGFLARMRKELAWGPLRTAAQGGRVAIIDAHWNQDFLDSIVGVPYAAHDDDADAAALAYNWMMDPDNNFPEADIF